MYCKNCQKDVVPSGNVCPECGAVIVEREKTVGMWGGESILQDHHTGSNSYSNTSANTAANPVRKSVGFIEAIKRMFIGYVDFSGRACRSEYWWAFLFCSIVSLIISVLSALFLPLIILSLGLVIPIISLGVRRLHDTGKSGVNLLFGLIPFAGAIILLIFFVEESDGDNKWGTVEKQSAFMETESFEEKVYRLSQEHEPKNVNTPDGKRIIDEALIRIIPTYSPYQNLSKAIMLCDPHQIKNNIQAMDADNLLIVIKGLRLHNNMDEDRNAIDMINRNVMNTLREKIS